MKITLKEVAKKAGVTPATVSLVLSGNPRISPETKKQVLKAVKTLGYRANAAARSLAGGRTGVIAVAAVSFSSWYELTLLRGIEAALQKTNYSLLQQPTYGNKKFEAEFLRSLSDDNRADALITIGLKMPETAVKKFASAGRAYVSVGEKTKNFPCVSFDDYNGAYDAVSYLASLGRKKIAIIAGRSTKEYPATDAEQRLKGYAAAIADAGLDFDTSLAARADNYYFEEGIKCFKEILNKNSGIDALFCAAGDTCAIGVIKEARNRRIRIPEDIALIGYDDIEMSQAVLPELTTVRQPVYDAGVKSFEMAVCCIQTGKKPADALFGTKLIKRKSA